MTYSFKTKGIDSLVSKLTKLQSSSPRMIREISKSANKNHNSKFRSRFIPYDTGRMSESFRDETNDDRELIIQDKFMSIASLVPYAIYQWHRVRPLNKQDMVDVFVVPIRIKIRRIMRGKDI